ncbi:hypothetical protein [Synechococcus sp. 8F6]|uniref:protein kinase domain-containing protein n=1 Tax=Synechococcus sp. 8F6 TaxID=2025606 RepID=UPI000B991A91|nr:hypothetical protein [Synechococcus sp. 8F6]
MSQRAFITSDGHSVVLPAGHTGRIGAGGQGQVYRTQLGGQPIAVKLCRQLEEARLIALQRLEPTCGTIATLPRQRLYHCRDGQRGALAGYAMRYVESKRSVSAARLFNFEEIAGLQRFTWKDAVLAALRLAESVAQLHRYGLVIGDLNPENVLFEQQGQAAGTSTWRAVILDSDSFQIASSAERFHCPVSRPPYTAPELIGADFATTWRDASSDAYALAVIVYLLLLHDHPYDNALLQAEPELEVTARIRRGLYPHAAMPAAGLRPGPYRPAPAAISEAMDAAFRRSFCCEPALRPTAAEWMLLLRDLHSQVVACSRNPRHQHVAGRDCLWCAVEQRIGTPISRYSPAPTSAKPLATQQTPEQSSQPAPADPQGNGLEALRDQLRLARDLVERRAVLVEQLLQLEPVLVEIAERCSSPEQLVDEQAVLERLSGLRNRISRWLGHRQKVEARQRLADQLLELATSSAASTLQQSRELEQQRHQLLSRLAGSCTAQLAARLPLQDPERTATALWRQAANHRQQRWLQQQLAQQPLRSWRMEGFGDGRMALLERHGLERGDQLLERIDQLTSLAGIGRGLQQRLRQQLENEIQTLQAHMPEHVASPQIASSLPDLLGPETLALIDTQQSLIDALQADAGALAIRCRDLNAQITSSYQQRDALQQSFNKLF